MKLEARFPAKMPMLAQFTDAEIERLNDALVRIHTVCGGSFDTCATVIEAVEKLAAQAEAGRAPRGMAVPVKVLPPR